MRALSIATAVGVLSCLGVVLGGCAQPPRRFDYPALDLKIVKDRPSAVDARCRRLVELGDDGEPLSGRRILCCYDSATRTIYAGWAEECLAHELCHVDGTRSARECGEVTWE